MKKAVVVGAGIGGLATALRLAQSGFDVEVFEQAEGPGGKLTSFERNGYRFDAGPSLFTLPHLIDELVQIAGAEEGSFEYIKTEESCRYFWEDGTRFTAWADHARLAAEIKTQFDVDPEPFLKHLEYSAFLYEKTARLFMERSLHKVASFISMDVLKALASVFKLSLNRSMNDLNQDRLNHPKIVQLFNRYATYNGSDPYRAPGVLNIIPHLEHNIGTFFPKGGMYAITQKVESLATEAGVKFNYNAPVKKILIKDKAAKGISTNAGDVAADLVISNADVFTTYRHLLPDQKAPEKIINRERSSSALIFYWGIKKTFNELGLHNILFSEDYHEEFRLLEEGNRVSDDPTVYINITSKHEVDDAPDGCENWFVMVNVPANHGQNWDEIITSVRQNAIKKINRMLKTEIKHLIECEEVLDPRLIESKTSSYMGALYGTASNDRMAAFLRHPNFTKSIDRLYFCGGSVHPGGGIPLCLLSAKIVCQLIENDHA